MQNLSLNELANEGERLCKLGDCFNGIKYFQEALKIIRNSHDQKDVKILNILSVIYNQLGNAYFYLQEYTKALDYHKLDYDISQRLNDEPGKAKACGNIGNTLQLLGDYDEAILYSIRNLEISIQLNDLTGEARALYNLGNIYQSKGKHMGRIAYNTELTETSRQEFPEEIREVLEKAISYYRKTLSLVQTKRDRSAEGRTYGNLGNTHYLLGEFELAIDCHFERLKIAKEYGDKAAERRAYSNLGNCHIFLSKYQDAAEFYLKAMNVARLIGDKAIEAQAYFSLGNVHSLLQDFSVAIDFHLRHLQIALLLEDRIGESRAFWSLANAYAAFGDLENAILYANKHLVLARQIGDSTSELNAKMNLYDFQNMLSCNSGARDNESALFTSTSNLYDKNNIDRLSVLLKKSNSIDTLHQSFSSSSNQLDKVSSQSTNSLALGRNSARIEKVERLPSQDNLAKGDESFLQVLSKIQSNRLNDQRSSFKLIKSPIQKKQTDTKKPRPDELNDEFFNLVMKSQQSRLEDQRSSIALASFRQVSSSSSSKASTTPDDEFFSMLHKLQSRRLDEQRSVIQPMTKSNSSVTRTISNGKHLHNFC